VDMQALSLSRKGQAGRQAGALVTFSLFPVSWGFGHAVLLQQNERTRTFSLSRQDVLMEAQTVVRHPNGLYINKGFGAALRLLGERLEEQK